MWEHTWAKMKKEDDEIIAFLKTIHVYEPLKARDALYGGATNAFILHYKCLIDEIMKYIDFTR
jgi:hypothetical protein